MITIGLALEQSLAAIRCGCGFVLDWEVLDRIVRDSQENQVASKHYVLHDSRRALLSASVDEYEPETVDLKLARGRCDHFDAIIAAALETGFDAHAYYFDRPPKPPQFLSDRICAVHAATDPAHPVSCIHVVAIRRLDAIACCLLGPSGSHMPCVVYSSNVRTLETRLLPRDVAEAYTPRRQRS